MGRYVNGMIAGVVVGATVGMMVLPQLDRKTQKSVRKAGQKVLDYVEDSYDGMTKMF
jgi:gas vesicle protein